MSKGTKRGASDATESDSAASAGAPAQTESPAKTEAGKQQNVDGRELASPELASARKKLDLLTKTYQSASEKGEAVKKAALEDLNRKLKEVNTHVDSCRDEMLRQREYVIALESAVPLV